MEKKKSVSTYNRVIENCEEDSLFCNGLTENISQAQAKQYNRDTLLQLRLHPLSLQKPKHLPELKIVQEKLYLHDIADTTSSGKCGDTNSYPAALKHEFCNMKHDYSLVPHYLNRMYPYCYSSHLYNGYQSTPTKYRSPYHLCDPLKKHCISSHQCYKDFSVDECLWAKQCYTSEDMWCPSEDMWYSSNFNSSTVRKKEHIEAVPKTRKKLSIIDPNTGKNVLEGVSEISTKQISRYSVEENSEISETSVMKDKYAGDYFTNTDVNELASDVPSEYNDSAVYSQEKVYDGRVKDPGIVYQTDSCHKALEETPTSEKVYESKTTYIKEDYSNAENGTAVSTPELFKVSENVSGMTKNIEDVQSYDASQYTMQEPNKFQNKETNIHTDIHGTCQTHDKKDIYHSCRENMFKQTDAMQENLRHLKEKMCALRQEKQKMAILQSFLRYKQYQLEETARNLDEKRLEIANWECNLYNEAKRLHEKKQWPETKSDILSNKAQQLFKRENALNKEEIGFSSDASVLKSGIKENERKFPVDIYNDSTWKEIPKTRNYTDEESGEYSCLRYGSNPGKIPEDVASSNVEQCRSETCLLDELEKNIVFIGKMNSMSEVCGSSMDNKTEQASSNITERKDESAAYDPIGYSKGRRYLPEHIKYWLNKRDKSAL